MLSNKLVHSNKAHNLVPVLTQAVLHRAATTAIT